MLHSNQLIWQATQSGDFDYGVIKRVLHEENFTCYVSQRNRRSHQFVSSKFYNRIIRHKCYEMLEAQKEKKSEYLTD